jgi:hypothetical protein
MPNSSHTPGGTLWPSARRTLLLLLGLLVLVAPAFHTSAAAKGTSWCRVDPGLSIGGRETHINLLAEDSMLRWADGPIQLVVTVPQGDEGKTKLLYMDSGFGYGYDLVIKPSGTLKDSSSGIDIIVQAYAPAGGRYLAMQVELVPVSAGKSPTYAKGSSDQWIALKGKV